MQVLVLEGKNDLGKCLRVTKIHIPRPLPLNEIEIDSKQGSIILSDKLDALLFGRQNMVWRLIDGGPFVCLDSLKLNVIIAAGPYTPNDSMQYEALHDLMKVVIRDKPDICILIGPFLDASHKFIEKGDVLETFEVLFQKLVEIVAQTAVNLKTKFLLVPSFKDAHGHCVYPTPAFPANR